MHQLHPHVPHRRCNKITANFLCVVYIRLLQFPSHGNPMQQVQNTASCLIFLSNTPSKMHPSPTTTPLAHRFWMNLIQNWLHVLQRNHRFCPVLSFWATTQLQPLCRSLRSSSDTRMLKLQEFNHKPPWLSHFLTLPSPHLEQSPPTHYAGTLLLSPPSKANSSDLSSPNILVKQLFYIFWSVDVLSNSFTSFNL